MVVHVVLRCKHLVCLARSFSTKSNFLPESVLSALKEIVGPGNVATSTAVREQHSKDESYHSRNELPDAVVFPQSTQDVSALLKYCNERRVPVIPFGTGTGMEGGVASKQGMVSFDLSQMDEILSVHADDFDVTVEAGVTRLALNDYLRDTGLWFPVDPGANASLGGMCSTSASGTNAVRYGTMRENVLNLEVVLADGRIIHTAGKGRRTKKTSAGYNLTNFFVGSEGTLGIITSATLKLHGIPGSIVSAVCHFPTVKEAVDTTVETLQCGVPIARIELLDEDCMMAFNKYSNTTFKEWPTLFLEFHASEPEHAESQARYVEEIAKGNNATGFKYASDQEERNKLWKARHNVFYAVTALRPGCKVLSTDVCVPVSYLPGIIMDTKADLDKHKIMAPMVGHVGDGNFHINLFYDPDDREETKKIKAIADRVVERALSLDGTCTGEHGIGIGKMQWLIPEIGQSGVGVMKQLKQALDPHGILNPGKVLQ